MRGVKRESKGNYGGAAKKSSVGKKQTRRGYKWIGMMAGILCLFFLFQQMEGEYRISASPSSSLPESYQDYTADRMIRFHVLANSDTAEDQALKRAVRDAILEQVAPALAASHSLDESRHILTELRPKMEEIGRKVVAQWGKDYTVTTDYGIFSFPTKSYGSLVLPAGEYEAVRVLIGKGAGANWWCVLFPPLCFVDIDHATAVPVDTVGADKDSGGKELKKEAEQPEEKSGQVEKGPVRLWLWEKIKSLFD